MRATWLTWRINRFEILFVLALAVFVGVSAWVLADQIRSLGLTDALCWPRDPDSGQYATPACDQMMERFWPLTSQANLIRVVLTIAPGLLGVILGVPIVAREVELRTASFSWALTPSRWRWLLARFLPMLLVGVVALAVVAWAGTTLFDALWLGRYGPDLTEVAAQGVALVVRGLAAVAVALLVGAIVGRTMPALLIAVVVFAGWGLLVVPRAQAVLADQRAVWQLEDENQWWTGDQMLTYVDYAYFDPSRTGEPGEPGIRVDEEAAWSDIDAQVQATCGPAPDDDNGDSPEYRAWAKCTDPITAEGQRHIVQASKVVHRDAWDDFVALDVVMSAVLGGVALALAAVVVALRRPE